MRSWIKGGSIGAILYPILHVVSLFAALCGLVDSNDSACRLAGWVSMHFFPTELFEDILLHIETQIVWYAVIIIIDVAIGFAIGAIITLLIRSIRGNYGK